MFQIIVIFGLLLMVDKVYGVAVETFLFEALAGLWMWTHNGNDLIGYLLLAVATLWWIKQWWQRYRQWERLQPSGNPHQ